MSREILRGTSEAALCLAENYQEYLIQRARRLTGEDSNGQPSASGVLINLLLMGTLMPTPGLMDFSHEVTPVGPDTLEMFGEGAARRAEMILEVTDSLEGTKKQSSNVQG